MNRANILYFLLISFCVVACDNSTEQVSFDGNWSLMPEAKESTYSSQALALSARSKLFADDPSIAPLLQLFSDELFRLMGHQLGIASRQNASADVIFQLDPNLETESYELDITDKILVKGGSYQALAMAKTSLLQLVKQSEGKLLFPIATIRDHPDASFRGLMIDLARRWHSVESVQQLINLAAFYKIRYLHLHFTDHQSFTFPTNAFPNLPTKDRHYSLEELKELEAYAQTRGVTIIPELEVPGHAQQFVEKYPELFGIENKAENPYIINMGNEEVYPALEKIIAEMISVFQASPYFHIGGDEAYFKHVEDDPKVKAYMQANGLGDDVHELYRHFLVRMNEIVKSHGKQMGVWEGFMREGTVQIPKDILVFEFETNRYLPNHLIEDGYTVINTSWQPLYVVNKRKWSPESIYGWNMWRWENWWDQAPSFNPIQVEKSPLVIGAEMCAWEQAEEAELPSLRKRVPAFSERIWNTEGNLETKKLLDLIEEKDTRLSKLIGDDRQEVNE